MIRTVFNLLEALGTLGRNTKCSASIDIQINWFLASNRGPHGSRSPAHLPIGPNGNEWPVQDILLNKLKLISPRILEDIFLRPAR